MAVYPGGRAVFLGAAIGIHAVVGYTLGTVLFDRPVAGAVGGVIPDCDLLFPTVMPQPFVHRGITHTALVAGLLVVFLARSDRGLAAAGGVGYGAHLLLDATTPAGVPIAYPLSTHRFEVVLGGHSPSATAAMLVGCLAVLWYHRWRPTAIAKAPDEDR